MTTPSDFFDCVGPVLEAGPKAQAVIAAIYQLNKNVTIQDHHSYLRVYVPHHCVVTKSAVEKFLCQPFHLPADLELMMPAFKGSLQITNENAIWTLGETS